MRLIFFVFYFLSVFLLACNKTTAPDCFQKGGKDGVLTRHFVSPVNHLILYDYIFVEIIPSDENYLEIEGPRNLLPEIITEEVTPGVLEIRNENSCNFVRSYQHKITVKLYMNITQIKNQSSGDILSNGVIETSYFKLDCWNSSGKIELNVQCDSSSFFNHTGVSDLFIQGVSAYTKLYNGGMNILDASKLESQNTFVNSKSVNSIYTTCNGYFFVSINSRGSIYYTGNPNTIDLFVEGSGALIHL